MTESLASGLKKIQFTKSLGSQLPLREQIPPALIRSNNINSTPLTAVRGHGNTGNSASSETYSWKPASSMPHSLNERSPVAKEIPSPFKMYPSPPIYPRPHTFPTKTKAKRAASSLCHSEDFGCELGSRYSGDGESICSSTEEGCVTMGVRPPPDGCFSDLSEDDEDVSGEDDYSDIGMKDDSFVDDEDSIFDNQSVGMDEMDEFDGGI